MILPPGFPKNKREIARGDRDGFVERTVKVEVAAEVEIVVGVGDTGAHVKFLLCLFLVIISSYAFLCIFKPPSCYFSSGRYSKMSPG